MNFLYVQATGELLFDGSLLGICYSGHGAGVNNPLYQDVHEFGPIPQGWYTIGKFFDDLGGKGPIVAHLAADDGNQMFGRSGFMIHGDNAKGDRSASEGCIIAGHTLRLQIAGEVSEGNNRLQVVERIV
ncbi:MAG: DUF2778 domain-containing protein [Acidobacteria bacterium]|nr:DUF2778 domain-containing protein [Acidobacteriota bacterium]